MKCCPTDVPTGLPSAAGLEHWVRDLGDGVSHLDLAAPGVHCAACIANIEGALKAVPGVTRARVNLSTRRIAVDWRTGAVEPARFVEAVERLGYDVRPFDPSDAGLAHDEATGSALLRALAVAGFAAGNIMLLSVSVWSGADGATRDMFHWLSALIALPTVAYAGQPFFRSAWAALKRRALNMDVPISLGVLLASAISLYETIHGGHEAFFDAAVTLLFFLLAGRYLDHMMRARARSAVTQLISLTATGATVLDDGGGRRYAAMTEVRPGMLVHVAPGEVVPVDGLVEDGASEIDRALVTGETVPEAVAVGSAVQAGTVNLNGPLRVRVTAAGADTFLAEMVRMMETAEQGKAVYVRIADRAARIYSPLVHLTALMTFAAWMTITGGDWHFSLLTAVAVLIITCPCALALAVPAVQIVASGMLFRSGIMVKDGAALERLAAVDTVVLDKTGTLTVGQPHMVGPVTPGYDRLAVAAGLARESRHPLSRALVRYVDGLGLEPAEVSAVSEHPGLGLEGTWRGRFVRLGSRTWCGYDAQRDNDRGLLELCLRIDGDKPHLMLFEDEMRDDAAATCRRLVGLGLSLVMLSGDREPAVRRVAELAGIDVWHAGWKPHDKAAYIASLQASGRKVLMVGDGINDAPALAAAHASMAPATASDIGRTAAGLVFLGARLGPVPDAVALARDANAHILQNFALAVIYNLIAVPVAVLGYASPLVAAVAMSTSSVVVVANALRLRLKTPQSDLGAAARRRPPPAPTSAAPRHRSAA